MEETVDSGGFLNVAYAAKDDGTDREKKEDDGKGTEPEGRLPQIRIDSEEPVTAPPRRRKGDTELLADTKHLRNYLRLYFYHAFKWKNNKCSFHLLYLIIMVLQATKVVLVTTQMFAFGSDRANFSSIVNRGHTTLRHLLLEHWDASWETLPYPPAHGDFAVYTIADIESRINFAVENLYNAPEEAIGFYKRLDEMRVRLDIFDFSGFNTTDVDDGNGGLKVKNLDFNVTVTKDADKYKYDINEDFKRNNITDPVKRLLNIKLKFELYSVRVLYENLRARCLHIAGQVSFTDPDNNGQVLADLDTLTTRKSCAKVGYNITDVELENSSKELGSAVIVFSCLSLLATVGVLVLAGVVFVKTRRYMKKNYRKYYRPLDDDETDLPTGEYLRFLKGWDVISFISDVLTMYGTIWIVFQTQDSAWTVATLDRYAVWLSVGNILGWVCLLRFFKFHNKFHLLFSTLYSALWDVMAYLFCVMVLFLGFWASGYVVLGPYHVKFATPAASMETLFSIVNGDEIFATMAILESKKAGGQWVWWFSRLYIGAYVSIFTIVVINLLIAIFMSAYENIRAYYENRGDLREEGPVEKALKKFLEDSEGTNHPLRSSLYELLDTSNKTSTESNSLKRELSKLIRKTKTGKDVTLCKPRTLRQIIDDDLDDEDIYDIDCGLCKCAHFHM